MLFGPPGTGRSQTIDNMIAPSLTQGWTVPFVSQKAAALEVVQRRLQEIGLGDYCLEVHSTQSQKSAGLGQLRRAEHGLLDIRGNLAMILDPADCAQPPISTRLTWIDTRSH